MNIPNHRPRTTSDKLLQFETSMNSHSKAEGNLEQGRNSKRPTKRHYCAEKETSVRREKHQILISERGESKIQRQISIPERDPDRQQERKISKCTTMRSKKYRMERGARRLCNTHSIQTSQGALQDERTQQGCPQNKGLFRSLCSYKGEAYRDRIGDTFQRKAVHCRQWRCVTYAGIVFSESHRKDDCSTVKQKSGYSQTATGIVVSDPQAKVYIKEFGAYTWIHLVKDSPSVLSLGRLCLGDFCSWLTGETPTL